MINPFTIQDTFWNQYQTIVLKEMIPYQYNILTDNLPDETIPKSHSIENFKIAAGQSDGEFFGQVFQDSDTYKWLEAASYALMLKQDTKLEEKADAIIDLICEAQEADGYLNTYFIVAEPHKKWQNLQEGHELYCAGHLIEAGVAYYEATGKNKLLLAARKFADLIESMFGEDEGKRAGIPGHSEIELALIRLYRTTNEKKYLRLAKYFIDFRGTDPQFFKKEKRNRGWKLWDLNVADNPYRQNVKPVREEQDAIGHAVRAVYLYTAMAMTAKETQDATLLRACEKMWNSIVTKRMYLTGGIGSSAPDREAFTKDYDLPNDTAYNETCASVGLIFFAKEMLQLTHQGTYGDILELALYNTVLGSIQWDGKAFFYTNPLEVNPAYVHKTARHGHLYAKRPRWHGCACCPPNAARLLASLNRYVWHETDHTLYGNLFVGGTYDYHGKVTVHCKTDYPYDGKITYRITGDTKDFQLAIRIPGYSHQWKLHSSQEHYVIKDGYLIFFDLQDGEIISLEFDLSMHRIYANPNISDCRGKCAFMAGPIVYCVEDCDNRDINRYVVNETNLETMTSEAIPLSVIHDGILGTARVAAIPAYYINETDELYSLSKPTYTLSTLTAIPYYLWGNRAEGKMRVWLS